MAIIEGLPGVVVEIRLSGANVGTAEFPDTDPNYGPDTPALSCHKYIESVDDAQFSIYIKADESTAFLLPTADDTLSFHVFVDGEWADGTRFYKKNAMRRTEHMIEGVKEESSRQGYQTLRRFKFASVTTVDGDATQERIESDLKKALHLGTIQIDIYRKRARHEYKSYHYRQRDGKPDHIELAEKSLKGRALSHGTSFSEGEDVLKREFVRPANDLNGGRPIASFIFKYRSKDALRAEMILPRTPSPAPGSAPELAGLSAEEIQKLAMQRLRDVQGAKVKDERKPGVKREINQIYDLTGETIPSREFKIVRLEDGQEAVDLTED